MQAFEYFLQKTLGIPENDEKNVEKYLKSRIEKYFLQKTLGNPENDEKIAKK